ncbi:MAG: hypothetical protein ACXWLR_13515 [Myxococcales bacterium]
MGRKGILGILGILLVAACGAPQEVSNLMTLERGQLVVSVVQEECLNGKSNQLSIFSSAQTIPDQYLVVMYPAATQEAANALVARHEAVLLFAPAAPIDVFAVHMKYPQARALAAESGVCEVFEDYFVLK